jgi:Terminase small subunit
VAELSNAKHEQFAQGVAKGLSATLAYTSAGYSAAGASQSARRLLRNAQVCARVQEIVATVSQATIALEICNRNARIQVLQDLLNGMRQVIQERAADPDMAEVPGGKTGLLCIDYKGKDATQPVYKADTALVAEMRATCKQAAEELGQWGEERKPETSELLKFTGTFEELLILYRRLESSPAAG